MKRIFCAALAAAMLTGCGAGSSSAAPAVDPAQPQTRTLQVAAVETAYGADMWHQVAAAFEDLYEGVTVELTVAPDLDALLLADMNAGIYPDVVHLPTGRPDGLTELMIHTDSLEELSDVLQMTVPGESVTVEQKLTPGFGASTLTCPYGDGKQYLAPMFISPCGLLYNAGLFEEKGWVVPSTWEEMWALGDEAASEDIALFTYPTAGYFDSVFPALLYEAGGEELPEQVFGYQPGIWQTAPAEAVLDLVAQLAARTAPGTVANADETGYLANQQLLLDGQALFMPGGAWVVDEMADAPRPDGFVWGFMPLPALTEGGVRCSYARVEECWIPAESDEKELAKEFVAFLYSDTAAELFAAHGAVQPLANFADRLSEETRPFYAIYDNGAQRVFGGFAATEDLSALDWNSILYGSVDKLVDGTLSRAQWGLQVSEVSDTLHAALKKR